ncbi:MAG: chemotaxis protein CheW [Planctomycetes bacterium]|nr:chemotaxis protein CheW [Planctomycetota bacterium]
MKKGPGNLYVCCHVGGLHIGVNLDWVQEINRLTEPTFVPMMPAWLRGLVNLRGNLVTVVDLGSVVCGAPVEKTSAARTVVVEIGDEILGLVVDSVGDVVDVGGRAVEGLPSHVPASQRSWFSGMVQLPDDLLLLLDVNTLRTLEADGARAGCA